jgi:hypothetical protein
MCQSREACFNDPEVCCIVCTATGENTHHNCIRVHGGGCGALSIVPLRNGTIVAHIKSYKFRAFPEFCSIWQWPVTRARRDIPTTHLGFCSRGVKEEAYHYDK